MKKVLITFLFAALISNVTYCQEIIEMQKVNEVYQIPCKVNDIPMKFIFDTGASNVSISITEAKFLFKQGLIKKEDFKENMNYQMANGDIIEGTKIILRTIEIGSTILKNVEATIVYHQNAPLLLGQSAISKLGPYTIDGNTLSFDKIIDENETVVFDTVPQRRRYYIPNLSKINNFIKEEVGFKKYILKEERVNDAWVKEVSPSKQKKNAKGKIYIVKGYSRVEYYEIDCKNNRIRSKSILYFNNKDVLEYACTDINYEYSDLSNPYVYEEYKEIYNFVCK